MPVPQEGAIMFNLVLLTVLALAPAPKVDSPRDDEAKLKKDYEKLLASLKPRDLAGQHPRAVAALRGQEPKAQIEALQTLARIGDPNALPLMVPLLESQDPTVRIWAGATVSQLVEQYTLRRRDPRVGDRVVLKPRGQNDLDLRPLAWLVVQMLKKADDGNTHAYAAVLIRYLELRELVPNLRSLLQSRHPAVRDKATWALEELAERQDPTKSR
jgi:HEAT repeat protein